MSLMMTCDYIFLLAWENLWAWHLNNANYSWAYATVVSVISKIIEFLLVTGFHRKCSKDRAFGVLGTKGWIKFLILSTFTLLALILLWVDEGRRDVTVFSISLGLMVMNIMFYFTMWDIVNKEQENQEYRVAQEKARGQLKLYESMEQSYREQRKRVHEFKNHIGCIQGLLEEERMVQAKEYVDRIQNNLFREDNPVKTGNTIIDVIVNQKYREARKEQIIFVMKLDRLEHFPMQEDDTVILLSNLLDNALEACKGLAKPEERVIKLQLVHQKERYVLVVHNTTPETVKIREGVAETTKSDKYLHGIGMHNIREILRKYHADSECKCENGWFTYSIILNEQV